MFSNLTSNQVDLIQWIVASHKFGETAKVHTVSGRSWGANSFHHGTLKSLIKKGLVMYLTFNEDGDPKGWTSDDGGFQPSTFEVELTREGWCFILGNVSLIGYYLDI